MTHGIFFRHHQLYLLSLLNCGKKESLTSVLAIHVLTCKLMLSNLKSIIQNSKFLSCYGVCHCLVGLCKLPFSGQSLTFFEQVLTLLSRYVLGTIPILRQYIFGLFQTHPPTTLPA